MRIKDESNRLVRKAKAASITNLREAGAYIRGMARKSIGVGPKSSAPGKPPRSRKGALKRAIFYQVNKVFQEVLIGPTFTAAGRIGHTHEFGGQESPKPAKERKANFKLEVGGHGPVRMSGGKLIVAKLHSDRQVERAKGLAASYPKAGGAWVSGKVRHYPARPFMGPALERSKARLPAFWANSVKGGV